MEININKKNEILKVAGECFSRYGYEKTTLDDIAKLVGLNRCSIYYYYKNKESIYSEIISIEAKNFMERIKNKIIGINDCKQKIITFLKDRFKYIKETIILHQLSEETTIKFKNMFINLIKISREMEIEYLSEILQQGILNNEIKAFDDTKRIAALLIGIAESIKFRSLNNCGCDFSKELDISFIENEIDFAVLLFFDGLKKSVEKT